jgi:hypothetical protein
MIIARCLSASNIATASNWRRNCGEIKCSGAIVRLPARGS